MSLYRVILWYLAVGFLTSGLSTGPHIAVSTANVNDRPDTEYIGGSILVSVSSEAKICNQGLLDKTLS